MAKKLGHPTWEAINQEDSSAVAMRSVAAALCGEFINVWNIDKLQESALRLVALGGKKAMLSTVERFVSGNAADPKWSRKLRTEHLARWAVTLYESAWDKVGGLWDAIIIGAPNGGVAHLATALGVPFLSQSFSTSFQDATSVDDVEAYYANGSEFVRDILHRNHDLAVVNHYDPLHDRFSLKNVNHVRYKLLELPDVYEAFIYQNLRPGGTIFFTDCRYAWPMYFIDERHWFQVGGLGGVPSWNFIQGNHPEIAALQQTSGMEPIGNWGLQGHQAYEMPESEWGTLPPLHQRLHLFARENAYNFVPVEGPHPEYFSYLAFRLWRRLFKQAHVEPQGVYVETFTQVAPAAVRKAALLPLWLPRNCISSLEYLKRVRRDFGQIPELKDAPVFWLPLPQFVETFDTVSWEAWMEALAGLDVRPLGMRPHFYPTDPLALCATRQELETWVDIHPCPVAETATVDMLLEEIRALRRQRV
ncbi:MAG: hypothetical protein JXA33_07800 [Anaerolineae bacterium]|nr:hypothetical protein [Anaerolineae bacterium]